MSLNIVMLMYFSFVSVERVLACFVCVYKYNCVCMFVRGRVGGFSYVCLSLCLCVCVIDVCACTFVFNLCDVVHACVYVFACVHVLVCVCFCG